MRVSLTVHNNRDKVPTVPRLRPVGPQHYEHPLGLPLQRVSSRRGGSGMTRQWRCPCCGDQGVTEEPPVDLPAIMAPAAIGFPPSDHVCDRTKTTAFGVWK